MANADYRFPIARPQRGVGTWPVFLHTAHAAFFVDAGHAWSHGFEARDLKISPGAELSANIVAGYWLPVSVTVGAAWARDGAHTVSAGGLVYVRIGRAF